MSNNSHPQFHKNDLDLIVVDEAGLRKVLQSFEEAIERGTKKVLSSSPAPDPAESIAYGTMFSGIALALIRLHYQLKNITKANKSKSGFGTPSGGANETENASHDAPSNLARLLHEAKSRVEPKIRALDLNVGKPSPLTSPTLGAILLRALSQQWLPQDPRNLLSVVELATAHPRTMLFRERQMGIDEVLNGRAGLLWAILEIWKHCPDQEIQAAFAPAFQSIHKLVTAMLEAGRETAAEYRSSSMADQTIEMPLMWPWIDQYNSLGAMHGSTGILSILLDPTLPRHSISITSSYPDIAKTITALCRICMRNDRYLPMSIPNFPSKRAIPLTQICHGTPGLLILLAAAKRNPSFATKFWEKEWDEALIPACDIVWQQGLLGKGCSLCHGISGNALSLLLLADPLDETTDGHLAAGFAMLLEAMNTPPFATKGEDKYYMPDHPWSLFEGLAGLVCAWSEASVLARMKLRVLELRGKGMLEREMIEKDEEILRLRACLLGFPALVGDDCGGVQVSLM